MFYNINYRLDKLVSDKRSSSFGTLIITAAKSFIKLAAGWRSLPGSNTLTH